MKDIESYRKEAADKISANDKIIADFKARVKNNKDQIKEDYDKTIADLEQRNKEMKKKMDDYKVDGKEMWETFKTQFSHGMDELGKAFTDLTKKK